MPFRQPKSWPEREDRFREMVLYISQRCGNDPAFGATKLNKTLFLADFLAFAHYGEPISGFEYQKLGEGPAPRRLLPIRAAMERDGALGIQEVPLKSGNVQVRTVNLRRPNLSVFQPEQVAILDWAIEALAGMRAEDVSRLTHKMAGWKAAGIGETIPYETIFLSDEPPTGEDTERGREIAAELGLARTA